MLGLSETMTSIIQTCQVLDVLLSWRQNTFVRYGRIALDVTSGDTWEGIDQSIGSSLFLQLESI